MPDRILKAVEQMPASAKYLADGTAIAVATGSLLDLAPKIAAVFSIVWLALQIYTWVERRVKNRKKKDES